MPIFKIQHITKYQYDRNVRESVNEIKIFSYQDASQEVLQHDLFITGSPEIFTFNDYWNNKTGVFNLLPPHKELIVDSRLVVRTIAATVSSINFAAEFSRLEGEVSENLKLMELSKPDAILSPASIESIIQSIKEDEASVAAVVQNCCEYIFKHFQYIKGITTIETTVDEILEKRAGVCQDFAHVMLQVLRTLKVPSRYVSGYICPNKNGLRGEGATHAWVEAWIPTYGWAGIDPTNNVWVTNSHVKLAVGRNFDDCTPVKGTFKGPARQNLSVFVSVGYEDGGIFEEINNVLVKNDEEVPVQKAAQLVPQ
jgi:transglutaminase-like putative cysteine protease